MPLAHRAGAQVVAQLPRLGRLLDHVGVGDALARHHVVVDEEGEVPAGGLAVHEAVGLDGRLLRVRRPLDGDARLLGPARRLDARELPADVGVEDAQRVVALQLLHDLLEEFAGHILGVAENPHGDLGVGHHLLQDAGEGDDRALVVLAGPQIEVPVGAGLHLAGAVVEPRVDGVLAPQHRGQEPEAVVAAQEGELIVVEVRRDGGVEAQRLAEVEVGQLVLHEDAERRVLLVAFAEVAATTERGASHASATGRPCAPSRTARSTRGRCLAAAPGAPRPERAPRPWPR